MKSDKENLLKNLKTYFKSSPGKFIKMLTGCLLFTLLTGFICYNNYCNVLEAVQSVGKDTVPSVVASENIYALLADANANAANGILTKQSNNGYFWKKYRSELNQVNEKLVTASENITYGDEERKPILTIMKNLGEYEEKIGIVRNNINKSPVNEFIDANKIMRKEILPAATELDKKNFSHLDTIYKDHKDTVANFQLIAIVFSIILIAILILTQIYMFKMTNRIINVWMSLATIAVIVMVVYAIFNLGTVEDNLTTAKQDAFDSIHELWKARATAYDANTDESLYLLLHGNKTLQSESTTQFEDKTKLFTGLPPEKVVFADNITEGFLGKELNNITFEGEKESAKKTLDTWIGYLNDDQKIRNLEEQGKHNEAVAFCIGTNQGDSNWQFEQFDKALGDTLDINQKQFDKNIREAFDTLNYFLEIFGLIWLSAFIFIILGVRQRLKEYRF